MNVYKQIVDKYFLPDSPIKIKKQFSGQGITDKGNFLIGCMAGPSISFEHLLHEMSHFAEREIPKLLEKPSYAWGFTFGRFWQIGNHWGFEPQSDQSVKREGRVWAFQYNLMKSLNFNPTIEEIVSSAIFMPAFSIYAANKVRNLESSAKDKERLKFLAEEVNELSQIYTLQKFEADWFERIEILKKKEEIRNG